MPFELLQLPDAAMQCVLQKLDQGSLGSTAASCNQLNHAVASSLTSLDVCCRQSPSKSF
jgi:hypothetical protein